MFCTLAGCSSDLPTVKGKVTLDGVPLPDAFVEFTPQVAGGSPSYGRTDTGGHYNLMFSLKKYGAVPGENVVRITTADVGDMGAANVPERVPDRYNRKTELRVEVKANEANAFDFDLVTEGAKLTQPKLNPDR
jgi:hypothetical protein